MNEKSRIALIEKSLQRIKKGRPYSPEDITPKDLEIFKREEASRGKRGRPFGYSVKLGRMLTREEINERPKHNLGSQNRKVGCPKGFSRVYGRQMTPLETEIQLILSSFKGKRVGKPTKSLVRKGDILPKDIRIARILWIKAFKEKKLKSLKKQINKLEKMLTRLNREVIKLKKDIDIIEKYIEEFNNNPHCN